ARAAWSKAVLEIDRSTGTEPQRTAARDEIHKEARDLFERRLEEVPDEIVARVLAGLLLESREPAEWTALVPTEVTSTDGTMFTHLPDGSILAGGPVPLVDTYTVTARTTVRGATTLRLEVLPHSSLPNTGPGRDRLGNFCLTEISMASAP